MLDLTKKDLVIRRAAKEIFGEDNAKVTNNGEVHVYGIMPNTNIVGWYLLGFTGTSDIEEKLFWPDGSLKL